MQSAHSLWCLAAHMPLRLPPLLGDDMDKDYINGEKRAPHGTGIAIALAFGVGFWGAVGLIALMFGG